jgi:two-component system phosphate regulon response regulator PhoB
MARVLLIEDEADLQQVLEYNLRQSGHEVRIASRGNEGLKLARDEHPDLILLDLMLPDVSGNEVCKQLKKAEGTAAIPVMMMTAKGEEIDRVLGFELGVDDYVVKPFSVRELLLRIQAVVRRHSAQVATGTSRFGALRIDREAYRVWVGEEEITLTALEFRLLLALFDGKNRVQTREVLLDGVWGYEAEVTTRTVDTHVKRLRQKLGGAGDYIETIRGVGYRFADAPPEVAA